MPQFPRLKGRAVTPSTHFSEYLLLLILLLSSWSFSDTFGGIFRQFRGAA